MQEPQRNPCSSILASHSQKMSSLRSRCPRSKADIRRELDALLAETGFREPDRAAVFELGEDTVWRYERPDYDAANLAFLKGKTQDHPKGREKK